MIIDSATPEAIACIVHHLKSGEPVAIPTETVYGLAADATNPEAIEKIFLLKRRPLDHPLIVHLAHIDQLNFWVRSMSDAALSLAQAFWPGPLTLILKKTEQVPQLVTAGQDTVGIRIPSHPVAQKILQAFAGGLAAPSANPFMALSPTTAQHVRNAFPADLWVVEGGAAEVGLESTIIDCSGENPIILRAGMITPEAIQHKTDLIIPFAEHTEIKHAGQHTVHYAPNTRLRLFSSDALNQALENHIATQQLGLLIYQTRTASSAVKKMICLSNQVDQYAQKFYAALHELDHSACDEIWVELPPSGEAWQAIHTRLKKAAAKFE